MIFRFVPKPTVHRHRARWAVFSKRFLEGTDRREPLWNAMNHRADVVQLWWAQSECPTVCFPRLHVLGVFEQLAHVIAGAKA
jgi:hypothetical protein